MTPPIALLGPQRTEMTAGAVMRRLAPNGHIVTINAGWQDREQEDAEVDSVFDDRTVNLALYQRAERVWAADPELRHAHRELQSRLRLLRQSYVTRLGHLMYAWSAVEDMAGDQSVLEPERAAALEQIRDLDAQHLDRVVEVRAEYETAVKPRERAAVVRESREVADLVNGAAGVAVAGGHVAVLMNRMRLFGVPELLVDKPVVAWSGGAMVMAEQVVLFHDNPPQGGSTAETLDVGFGYAPGVVPLPHARDRLHLADAQRVQRLSRRFHPSRCLPLDSGEGVLREGETWTPLKTAGVRGARTLELNGLVKAFAA